MPRHRQAVERPGQAAAVDYAIARQRNRRNLTDGELLRCIAELDKRMTKSEAGKAGADAKWQASHEASPDSGKSAADTAEKVGASRAKVERARTVIDHAPPEVKQAVESGGMTINSAYKATQQARRGDKPKALAIDPAADPYSRYYDELLAVAEAKPKADWPHIWKAMQAVATPPGHALPAVLAELLLNCCCELQVQRQTSSNKREQKKSGGSAATCLKQA